MRKIFKNITLSVFLMLTVNLSHSQSEKYGALTYNKAVNISGKQRMLTQRMGKIYLYLLSNPNDFKAKKDLKITKIIFEKQNNILDKNTEAPLTKERIKEVKDTWEKYKKFLASEPNKDDAVKIINTNSTILKYANNVVNAIILESKGKTNSNDSFVKEEDSELKQIINKSGRQRMLSQRLALYYFANKPELKTPKSERNLKSVYTELDNALNDLLISSFNNDRIDEALGDVSALWESVTSNSDRLFKQGYEDAEMYKLSNQLTKTFNKITNLYEKVRIE
ncbi:type IV pili methyl-accepting chemotaxis transducer N-terminal domain-containing protein [uncultured Tenacibaculum sp.]|uniref:type IV pili methyl-accepting chemotaxis transducer N-terminal domain-containing protein n=1 Tax=uncultured Tenacibaculum sp. TaxID=174713 RepID=UPI0026070738|nr:type IV pili methyl-accepting chemotaxis transducer N-terminal domain-containing protein [uncultured Tenacibaculum sp.]